MGERTFPARQEISTRIQALSWDGAPTNWTGDIQIEAFTLVSRAPVLSEVDVRGEAIELVNPGRLPLDISQWEIQALRMAGGPSGGTVIGRLEFPAATILQPGVPVVFSSLLNGNFPLFKSAKRLSSFDTVRLWNAEGVIVDEVFFAPAQPSPNTGWKGRSISVVPREGSSHQRIGFANHFSSADWATNAVSPGQIGNSLILPWDDRRIRQSASPTMARVTDGVWEGSISISEPAAEVFVLVTTSQGIEGISQSLRVTPLPTLDLSTADGQSTFAETKAGAAGSLVVTIPNVRAEDLVVRLEANAQDEFLIPDQ
ncbi:MAG: lamin tail domain-containing protein, partial [Verrucomicrobiota bacterium]